MTQPSSTAVSSDEQPAHYLRDPYLEWRQGEGIPVHEGFGIDCHAIDLGPWPRLGGRGAWVDLAGRGDYCDIYVAEIPPGGHLEPERHLFEETIHVLAGRGTTTIGLPDGEIDYRWALTQMVKAGYDGWISIESGGGDSLEHATADLAYLKRLLTDWVPLAVPGYRPQSAV